MKYFTVAGSGAKLFTLKFVNMRGRDEHHAASYQWKNRASKCKGRKVISVK